VESRGKIVFVTGATGFIGIQLVKRLVESGTRVHALYRSESKSDQIRIEGVKLFKGDITDKDSLKRAMAGCEQAYHIAAFAGVWAKNPETIHQLNVEGTLNVIAAASEVGLSRIVVTSTAGILGPSEQNPVHEETPPPDSFFTLYEESKYIMEQAIKNLSPTEVEVVIVNPTRVYGPGFLSESNGVTKMIKQYVEGNWKLIPGDGERSGNYAFVEDVVTGHLLSMEKGEAGERYILGGENISYNQLFNYTREASGITKRLYKIPLWLMLLTARLMMIISRLTGNPPMIVPNLVRKFNHSWIVSSDKAISELGYKPIDAKTGIEKTVRWIESINLQQNTDEK